MPAVSRILNWRVSALLVLTMVAALSGRPLDGAEPQEPLIVTCQKPCDSVLSTVAALGGEVTAVYENLDAVAVTVPRARVGELSAAVGADAVRKDVTVALPPPVDLGVADAQGVVELSGEALEAFTRDQPANYNYNNALTGASTLHAGGTLGQGIIVAVIDSGTQAAAPALGPVGTGTVIGGENFVPLAQDPVASATSRLNDWHGTAVGSMIAAHANFLFGPTSRTPLSLLQHAPASVFACGTPAFPTCPAGVAYVVPMLGTAPSAKIYALKVFPSQGGGAPESRIIAAMDRAITLRKNFNSGGSTAPSSGTGTENDPFKYDALNIQVVNLSLGGPTLFAGRDVEDQLTLALLDAGITVVTSAGNDGFAAMTGGSPGTGFGSLTVGASNTPVHERVLRDNQFGVGIGVLYRPFEGVQTAYFSSRGPTADGRVDPDLSANGFASFVNVFAGVVNGALVSCGAPGGAATCASRILFASGTSFSSPTVAGAAALLRQSAPDASAIETRNALAASAHPGIVVDGSGAIDQGPGFLDIPEARSLLLSGKVKDTLPDVGHHRFNRRGHFSRFDRDDREDELGAGGGSVILNVRKAGLRPVHFSNNRFSTQVKDLLPGQVAHFFVPSDRYTERLVVSLTEIVPEGPVNTLFGDDLLVMGVDAPTSFALHRIEDPPGSGGVFVNADRTFTIDHPQTGLVRIGIQGDWTNNGRISAKLTIERVRAPLSRRAAEGRIAQDDVIPFVVDVPAGAGEAVFELAWLQNWGRYPTNDLDMLVLDPNMTVVEDASGNPLGSTLSSPERAVVVNPAAGTWTVLVNGFLVHEEGGGPWKMGGKGRKDEFSLRATADGEPLQVRK